MMIPDFCRKHAGPAGWAFHPFWRLGLLWAVALLHLGCTPIDAPREAASRQNNQPADPETNQQPGTARVRVGAEVLIAERMALLQGKRVALVVNHTSTLPEGPHLVDTLLAMGVDLVRIFAPEHGFRGEAEAGAVIRDGKDAQTGLPVVSLYGRTKQPATAHLADVDIVVFDIQDVGVRCYTYISTLSLVMEACARDDRTFLVLDRPNPNGWIVDGPMLNPDYASFVGMHPIPLVHGLTVGEYARMVNHQGWIDGKCRLQVVPMEGWTHGMTWDETGLAWPIPSPNLRTPLAARLYPVLCWYEGTRVSVGRGTMEPFTMVGFPYHQAYKKLWQSDTMMNTQTAVDYHGFRAVAHRFRPRPLAGISEHPPYQGKVCWGRKFRQAPRSGRDLFLGGLTLLQNMYQEYQEHQKSQGYPKEPFFNGFFRKLVGSDQLQQAVEAEKHYINIYESWQPELRSFRDLRAQFLMYPESASSPDR